MSVYSKKLHIRKDSTVTDIDLHTEAISTPSLVVKDGDTKVYARLGDASNRVATPLHVRKDGTTYSVLQHAQATVTIKQQSNETMTVTADGKGYTSTFKAEIGTPYTCAFTYVHGYYNAGTLPSNGTVTGDITLQPTAPTIKQATVTVVQQSNQTMTVTCNGKTYTSTFTAPYGSTYSCAITYIHGYYNKGSVPSSGTVTGNITLKAGAPSIKYGTVTINQSSNQTIHVYPSTGGDKTSSFSVPYGTTCTCKVYANSGYNAGSLNTSSFTVTGNVTVYASAASVAIPTGSFTFTYSNQWTVPTNITRMYHAASDKRYAVYGGLTVTFYSSSRNGETNYYFKGTKSCTAYRSGDEDWTVYYSPAINNGGVSGDSYYLY